MNPWSRAREAERRAAIAEERAAFLEREIDWMRRQTEESRAAETTALKIAANVAYQQAFGIKPFPEAEGVPPRESAIREGEQLYSMPRATERAMAEFKKRELELFNEMQLSE